MGNVSMHAQQQYKWVKQSRAVLFAYCDTISPEDFVNGNSSFGRGGSIRNLLVHIANTYEFWVMHIALKQEVNFTPYTSITQMTEVRTLFAGIDNQVDVFMASIPFAENDSIAFEIKGEAKSTTAFELFTHVITHEFHHKGQLLSLSRHLGYVPVDTDILR